MQRNIYPHPASKIRASRYAAQALLARVYLYKKDYASAITAATDVIDNGGYTLLSNYSDIFSGEETAESIFEVDFTALDRNRIAEYNFPLTLNGRREVEPATDLLNSYNASDERLYASVAYAGTLPYAIKYDDLSTGSDNFIVLRLAEMYLIRAEARAMLSGPADLIRADINAIRNRANLADITTNTYPELISMIESERRLELAFEGHRWFDLVRTGRAVDVLVNVTNTNQTLFPIPLSEILSNTNPGMTQNPGYQ